MGGTKEAPPRPYHHGDLRRGLVDAARKLLEREGPTALSLRAVAREAGVSPAAPYHHFKDKGELMAAVAQQGWELLNGSLAAARDLADGARARMSELGVAYVKFARENPALYRVMYDSFREAEALPGRMDESDSAFCRVRESLIEGGADPDDWVGLELAAVAAWCASHGLAEMAGFAQFERLKDAMGGEDAFLHGVFDHLRVYANILRAPASTNATPPKRAV